MRMTEIDKKSEEDKKILEMLKDYYNPLDRELPSFDNFYNEIEAKLEAQNPARDFTNKNKEIEEEFLAREQKIKTIIAKLEKRKQKPAKEQQSLLFALGLSLAVMAGLMLGFLGAQALH